MRGMGNMQQMMKQAQKLQKQMMEAKATLDEQEFVGTSTNDYVKATVTGAKKLVDLEINEAIVDPEDVDMLNDMVVQAVNAALDKAKETEEKTMGRYTQGLPF